MGTVVKPSSNTGGDYKPAPAGNHVAVCVGVIDLGHHYEEWDGKGSWKPKIRLVWELSDELMEDGRPFTLSRTFNLSLHENAGLRKFVQPWRGRPFGPEDAAGWDARTLLGQPCMLTVSHNKDDQGRTWANVEAAAPLPKRIQRPEPVGELVAYSVEDGEPPASLPERTRNKIKESREFGGKAPALATIPPAVGPPAEDGDDAPF